MKQTHANSIERCSRRRFLAGASALTAASCLASARLSAAEPAPEIRKLRLMDYPAICAAPQYVAESLLKAEGFAEIEYVKSDETIPGPYVGPAKADIDMDAISPVIKYLDNELPVVVLAGLHLGCYELFGTEQIRTIRDLKGKTIGCRTAA
jgi:NitT/TauT family transport system substrate-binding protein